MIIVSKCLLLFIISLTITILLAIPLIKIFKSLGAKQTIREDGPAHHRTQKSNIPTMGGVIFLIPVILLTVFLFFTDKIYKNPDFIIVFSSTLIMGLLGFTDDLLKIIKKHNKGVSGWFKLFIQLVIVLIIFFYLFPKNLSTHHEMPGIIYLLWIFFVISGASNSFNLTDGLDGLLCSISIASFAGYYFLLNNINRPELACFIAIFIGSLLGFFLFNKHPAKIFMGDTGSLAIGGAIGSIALVSHTELFLILFATVPILEALSVILQVVSCKLSKRFLGTDKRIFKMAPLHHHFELCGWKETEIVKRFFGFQTICTLVGVIFIYLSNRG